MLQRCARCNPSDDPVDDLERRFADEAIREEAPPVEPGIAGLLDLLTQLGVVLDSPFQLLLARREATITTTRKRSECYAARTKRPALG